MCSGEQGGAAGLKVCELQGACFRLSAGDALLSPELFVLVELVGLWKRFRRL